MSTEAPFPPRLVSLVGWFDDRDSHLCTWYSDRPAVNLLVKGYDPNKHGLQVPEGAETYPMPDGLSHPEMLAEAKKQGAVYAIGFVYTEAEMAAMEAEFAKRPKP